MSDRPPAKVTFTDVSTKPRRVFFGLVAFGAIAFAYTFNLFHFKSIVRENVQLLAGDLEDARSAAQSLNTEAVADSLRDAQQKIQSVENRANSLGLPSLAAMLNGFLPGLKTVPETLRIVSDLSALSVEAAQDINTLKQTSLELFTHERGSELIAVLEHLADRLERIEQKTAALTVATRQFKTVSNALASVSDMLERNYLPVSHELADTREFIQSLLALLKAPEPARLLLMFQNPTEIRPAGGFLGSFGYLTFEQGNLKEIKVDDIYNADRQLDIKMIPPREMQALTRDWEARDANWFANFPTSARKVISFLEQADLFRDPGIQFAGTIAINTNVLKTLIAFLGPIQISEYNLSIDADNFLQELQYEVEAGRDHKPGQNPKKILSALTPLLIEKMEALTETQKHNLLNQLKAHVERKDILLYFKDKNVQRLISGLGMSGELFSLPESFVGDYLMVINANLAGGKTDAFIEQTIDLQSQLDEQGNVTDELQITRGHTGQNEEEWWYTADNKNYIKMLTPPQTELQEMSGNNAPRAKESYPYEKNGYHSDPDLAAMENSETYLENFKTWAGNEFGKTSFGTRLNIPAGETKTIVMRYRFRLPTAPSAGLRYQFIFEKQSGVQGALRYRITAPNGYVWAESGDALFSYENINLKAREIIDLTLIIP